MRSFLIRDILSGPAANQASQAAGSLAGGESSGLSSLADLSHHHHHHTSAGGVLGAISGGQLNPGSSSFDSLAASQALLFKLAEHQQQFQANKYYEQLQHQHQHLLNNLTNLNGSSSGSSSSSSNHPLQLVHQSSAIGQHNLHHHQLISSGNNVSFIGKTSSTTATTTTANSATDVTTSKIPTKAQIHNDSSKFSGSTSGHGNNNTLSTNKRPQKTSSFAYDCVSPISSISDVERDEDGVDEDDDDENGDDDDDATDVDNETNSNEKHHRRLSNSDRHQVNSCRNSIKRERNELYEEDVGDNDDDDDEEIEVEKVGNEDDVARNFYSHRRPKREDYDKEQNVNGNEGGENVSTSDRSTNQQQQQLLGKQFIQLNSPLDALFQMTSSTFDALKRGEKRKDRDADNQGSTNFTSKQTSKKKRKSRTAFTNQQIYELERRFSLQKYLSPTDRDEIAITLNLSNAQVITWFQNRRAKLKRDLEEQKRDIETASLLNFQKTFFESFQALSQMNTAINPTDTIRRTRPTNVDDEKDYKQIVERIRG